MRVIERERGKYPKIKVAYMALPCMHCENAPCVTLSANNAVYRRPDGIVIIDPEKAKGQKEIVTLCPYRVIYWNEEKGIPQKCTFCAHLLDDGWKEPRCAEACPTSAIVFGDLDDPESEVSKLVASGKAEMLHPEYGLKTSVQYIGLPKRFIAGTVVFAGLEEAVILRNSQQLANKLENRVITKNDILSVYAYGRRVDLIVVRFSPKADAVRIHCQPAVCVIFN